MSIPWQDRPAGSNELIWRFDRNPLTGYNPVPDTIIYTVYNSAVLPYKGAFIGVFRVEYRTGMPGLHLGRSSDGIQWTFDSKPLPLHDGSPEGNPFHYAYDPRLGQIDGKYYVTWCNGFHGPTIGIAETTDFRAFNQLPNAFLPCNRNGVLFPRRINGRYAMLSRPSDNGHTPFGEIFYSESPDLEFWGRHRHVMGKKGNWWEDLKIGPGPIPIETPDGWLIIYHGVANTCNGFVYRMGLALLDLEQPWKVVRRLPHHIFGPEASYETTGFVPNVVFPCSVIQEEDRMAIYYGAADCRIALGFARLSELLDTVKKQGC